LIGLPPIGKVGMAVNWHLVTPICILPHEEADISVKSMPQGDRGYTSDLTMPPGSIN
jgi:hypothetical protein